MIALPESEDFPLVRMVVPAAVVEE